MAWQVPKTDWTGADGVRNTDLNRIEGNILHLYNESMVHADITVVVDPTGNDTTGAGTAAAPYASITKALSAIPKNLSDKVVTIDIGSGTYNENVVIRGISGVINLYSAGVVSVQSLTVDGCKVSQQGSQMNFPRGITLINGACYIGRSLMYVSGSNAIGVKVHDGSTFVLYNTATISNTTSAAMEVSSGSRAYVATLAGTSNTIGLRVDTGGIAAYGASNIAATTQRVTNTGGRIYSAAQTSIPNY